MSIVNGALSITDSTSTEPSSSSYDWQFANKGDTLRVMTDRTPSGPSATGLKGEICWDENYIYVCVDTNSWKRAAISALLWI